MDLTKNIKTNSISSNWKRLLYFNFFRESKLKNALFGLFCSIRYISILLHMMNFKTIVSYIEISAGLFVKRMIYK